MKKHYKCSVMYDGSRYNGWQRQHNTPNTIQEILEQRLSSFFKETLQIRGSGRTDAGVHALNQVFDFYAKQNAAIETLPFALNELLPPDIRILSAAYAPENFHSRKSAKAKIYEYRLDLRPVPSPFTRKYALSVPQKDGPLALGEMEKAALLLCGRHDFASFTSDKRAPLHTVRTLYSIDFIRQEHLLIIRFTGDGFLYNMVRILVGTLLEVGLGRRTADSVAAFPEVPSRQAAGPTAPPHGLFLCQVIYESNVFLP